MSRQCGFCQRWFNSKQAVRAHLKHCRDYLEAKAAGLVTPRTWAPKTPEGPPGAPEAPDYTPDAYSCGACSYVQATDFSVCPACGARF